MANRANPYGYSDPAMGAAVSNLAQALFGSAHDDAYIASAQANRALAQKRAQEVADAQALSGAMQTTSQNPVFQGRVYEAMGLGPVQADESGNFIRPVGPNDPQMSVPVLPNQYQLTPQQHSALARTFLGEGGNTQQTMAGLNNLGTAISHRTGERYLLNPDAPGVTENMLRGSTILLKGAPGVNADFAPTGKVQRQVQDWKSSDIRYGDDQKLAGVQYGADQKRISDLDRNQKILQGTQYTANQNLAGKRYEVQNRPVIVNQNGTAYLPEDMQGRFNNQTELRGQQSPVIVPQGSNALIPDDRKQDFNENTTVQGQPKPASSRNSGGADGKTVTVPKHVQDRMDTQMDKQLKDKGIKLTPEVGQALRSEVATIWQSSRNPDGAADAVFQALINGNSVNGVALKQEKGFFSTTTVGTRDQSGQVITPKKGDIRRGFRFKGGDPSQQASWEKL